MMSYFTTEEIERLSKGAIFYKDDPQLERAFLINTCSLLLVALKNGQKKMEELEGQIEEMKARNEDAAAERSFYD